MTELEKWKELDGTTGESLVMYIESDNTLYPEWQYAELVESGYFGKRQSKIPWRATHREAWEWRLEWTRFNGGQQVLNRVNFRIETL